MGLLNKTDSRRVIEYWLNASTQGVSDLFKVPQFEEQNKLGFLCMGVSEANWEKVVSLYRRFFYDLNDIVNNDKTPPIKFKILNLHIIDISQLGQAIKILLGQYYKFLRFKR